MIHLREKIFDEGIDFVSFEKYFEESKATLWCKVMIGNAKFSETQKDVFNETLSDIVEYLQWDDVYFEWVRNYFETSLQLLNNKLQAFSGKMNSDDHYDLRGVMQIFFDDQYVSALIWLSSLLIFRNDKLVYSVSNAPTVWKIDVFSELIEGDLEEDDQVIVFWNDVQIYFDQDDLTKMTDMARTEDIHFVDQLLEIIWVRVDEKKLWFYQDVQYTTGKKVTKRKLKKWMLKWVKSFWDLMHRLKAYSTPLLYGVSGFFVLLLLYRALQGFMWDAETLIKDDNGDILVDFTIEDIQQDISRFESIPANSDEKVKAYNQIMSRLNTLEEKNLRTFDVSELKWIAQQEYKDWFNIKYLQSPEDIGSPVYTFTQQEKNSLWEKTHLYMNNWFMVSGEDGVLVWAINETVRWSLVSSAIGQKLESCYFNLLKNGLFCASSDWSIYNIDKNWFSPVTTDDGKFPRAIQALGTRRTSNMYTLTNDTRFNQQGSYILRFQNKVWSQASFGKSTQYVLWENFKSNYPNAFGSWGTSSFAIDSTFIVRSKWDQWLYQLWKEWTSDTIMDWRKINLKWWDTISNPFSDDVKVFASATDRTIQFFDKTNQHFSVYRTNPLKTTNPKERNAEYLFMINFDLWTDNEIIDVYVEEWEKSQLYIMTKEYIYKLPLHEWLDAYIKKAEEE